MKWILSNMTPLNFIINCQQFSKSISTDFSPTVSSVISNHNQKYYRKNATSRKKNMATCFWWRFHSSLLIKERIRFELMNLCSSVLYSMFCLCWDLCQSEKQKSWIDPINAPPCRNRQFSDELFKHRHSFPSLFSFISRAGTDVSVAWALLLKTGIFFLSRKEPMFINNSPNSRCQTRTNTDKDHHWASMRKGGKKIGYSVTFDGQDRREM